MPISRTVDGCHRMLRAVRCHQVLLWLFPLRASAKGPTLHKVKVSSVFFPYNPAIISPEFFCTDFALNLFDGRVFPSFEVEEELEEEELLRSR